MKKIKLIEKNRKNEKNKLKIMQNSLMQKYMKTTLFFRFLFTPKSNKYFLF